MERKRLTEWDEDAQRYVLDIEACPRKHNCSVRFIPMECTECLGADALQKLAAYEDAEEEGRLVVLPCKVGEIVWWIGGEKNDLIGESRVLSYKYGKEGWVVLIARGGRRELSCFGKTVFLTREEAEAALERKEENN